MAWWAISTELYWEQRAANPTRTIILQLCGLRSEHTTAAVNFWALLLRLKMDFLTFCIIYCFISTACINYLVRRRWYCFGLLNSAFYVLGGLFQIHTCQRLKFTENRVIIHWQSSIIVLQYNAAQQMMTFISGELRCILKKINYYWPWMIMPK